MSIQVVLDELRKAPDDLSREKILHNWFGKEVNLKTRIPKQDVIPLAVLEGAICKNKRYTKVCGLKSTIESTNNIIDAFKLDVISEDGASRGEFERVIIAERNKAVQAGATMERWLGKE
jgi:hypothetical protein